MSRLSRPSSQLLPSRQGPYLLPRLNELQVVSSGLPPTLEKDAAAAAQAAFYTTVPSFTVAFFSITTIPDLM
jgi:hypothetical protein